MYQQGFFQTVLRTQHASDKKKEFLISPYQPLAILSAASYVDDIITRTMKEE